MRIPMRTPPVNISFSFLHNDVGTGALLSLGGLSIILCTWVFHNPVFESGTVTTVFASLQLLGYIALFYIGEKIDTHAKENKNSEKTRCNCNCKC